MLLSRRELIKAALRGLLTVMLGGIRQPEADAIRVEPDVMLKAGEPVGEVRQPRDEPWLEVGGRLYACAVCRVKAQYDCIELRGDSGEYLGLTDLLTEWKITAILKGDGDGLREVGQTPSAVDVVLYAEGMAYGGRGILDEFIPRSEFVFPSVTILGDGDLRKWTI